MKEELATEVIGVIKNIFTKNNIKFVDTKIVETYTNGYDKKPIEENVNKDINDYLYQLFNFKYRYIPPDAKNINISKEFDITYNKLDKKDKDKVDALIEKMRIGKDVNNYQSKSLKSAERYKKGKDAGYSDTMFNMWGINHLHLTEGGSGNLLLFLMIKNSNIYIIDVETHENIWWNNKFLKIIENNWSYLLDDKRLEGNLVIGTNIQPPNKDLFIASNKGWSAGFNVDNRGYRAIGNINNQFIIKKVISCIRSINKYESEYINNKENFIINISKYLSI